MKALCTTRIVPAHQFPEHVPGRHPQQKACAHERVARYGAQERHLGLHVDLGDCNTLYIAQPWIGGMQLREIAEKVDCAGGTDEVGDQHNDPIVEKLKQGDPPCPHTDEHTH